MANPTLNHKRVRAARRSPDGSAYQKCDSCGVSVPIALADMHECKTEKIVVKKFKGVSERQNVVKPNYGDQPRSPFRLFMESFAKTCKTKNLIIMDQNGLDTWKNMSKEEREPYIVEAERIDSCYLKALLGEVNNMQEVGNEADSPMVGNFDQSQFYEDTEDSKNSSSFDSFQYGETENLDTGVHY